jgi:3-hydroxyisobutyrate dehydrogenase
MASAKSGLIIVDTSTITPAAVQNFSQKVADQGCTLLDAPMSGGESGTIAGTLTFMVGGEAAAVEQARDVFDAMSKLVYHVGASNMGATVKLCNNLMLGINLVGVCEAFTLGAKDGVDAQTIAEYPFFLY